MQKKRRDFAQWAHPKVPRKEMSEEKETPLLFGRFLGLADRFTRSTSDIMLVLLFSVQILFQEFITSYGVNAIAVAAYWVWRRDNWLVTLHNVLLFFFINNEYFDLLSRLFLFYCAANLAYYVVHNKTAAVFHALLIGAFAFFGDFGFPQYRDISVVFFASLFLPLFFGDIQNELLNVHFYAPYVAAGVLLFFEDRVHVLQFVLCFATVWKKYPVEYPTYHNTCYSRHTISMLVVAFLSFYYVFNKGVGVKSYNTSYDALLMLTLLATLVISYLGFVFWDKISSRQYRYGFTALHSIVAFANSILLLFTFIIIFTETFYKLWFLPPFGNDRSLVAIIVSICTSLVLLSLAYKWNTLSTIHRTIYAHIMVFIVNSVGLLVSFVLMNYFDMYRADVIIHFIVAGYTLYLAFPLIKETGSYLMINSTEHYQMMHLLIDDWARVEHIAVRNAGDQIILEGKCQIRDRRRRVGVAAKGLYQLAKKMGLDYTIEIHDLPPKPK